MKQGGLTRLLVFYALGFSVWLKPSPRERGDVSKMTFSKYDDLTGTKSLTLEDSLGTLRLLSISQVAYSESGAAVMCSPLPKRGAGGEGFGETGITLAKCKN
jgi:hypothetical protein